LPPEPGLQASATSAPPNRDFLIPKFNKQI
jgi:hypothetical protein